MTALIVQHENIIPLSRRQLIASRYHTVTRAVNKEFWGITSDSSNSLYVGSYGRGTAISSGDIDIMVILPRGEYDHFQNLNGNSQSRFLQAVKNAIMLIYPTSDVRADGQIIKINFSDGMKFEILPAFPKQSLWGYGNNGYDYADSNHGGKWRTTHPKEEQDAVTNIDRNSNGLYRATCKHIRYIRDNYFCSYHLAGIVIDSFVYHAIGVWGYSHADSTIPAGTYETMLLKHFRNNMLRTQQVSAPGSGDIIDASDSIACLEKVMNKIAL